MLLFGNGPARTTSHSYALPLAGLNLIVTHYKKSNILRDEGPRVDLSLIEALRTSGALAELINLHPKSSPGVVGERRERPERVRTLGSLLGVKRHMGLE